MSHDRKQRFVSELCTGAGDNTVLGPLIRIPAYQEVIIFSIKALVDAISVTADCKIELVQLDAAGDILLASVGLTAALGAAVNSSKDATLVASKFSADTLTKAAPVKLASSTSERILTFVLDQAHGNAVACGELICGPFDDTRP